MTPPYRSHRFRSADGRLDLHARIYPGEGPPLLLMHGLTRNGADFEPLAAHLAGDRMLLVPDQRGRGLSAWDDDPGRYRPDVYAEDMFALLDGLGIASAGLVGTSMGGLMAMIMGATRPARVPFIILNDVGAQLDPAGLARIQSYTGLGGPLADWDAAAARCAAINGSAFPDFGPADWDAFARRTCRATATGEIVFDYDPAIGESIRGDQPSTVPPDLWPLWRSLAAIPVLVVRGALSDLLSAETLARMAADHPLHFSAVEVPRRGHAPLLDEPEALDAIRAFLRGHGR